MPMFGNKPPQQPPVRRFEFASHLVKLPAEQRQANALEYIAYSLGRIEMHLAAIAERQAGAEPKGEEQSSNS